MYEIPYTPTKNIDVDIGLSDGPDVQRIIIDTKKLRLFSEINVMFNWTLPGSVDFTLSYGVDGTNWIDYTINTQVKVGRTTYLNWQENKILVIVLKHLL